MKILFLAALALSLTTFTNHAISAEGSLKTVEPFSLKSFTPNNGNKAGAPPSGIDTYGFEVGEGFSPGFLGGQAGWSVLSTGSTVQPIIDSSDPALGSQHFQLGQDTSLAAGTLVGGLSPNLGPQPAGNESRVSVDVKITADLGANYNVFAQSPSTGQGSWNVMFYNSGNIFVGDDVGSGYGYINSGSAWPVNTYFNLEVITNPGGSPSIEYYLDGTLFYTQVSMLLSDRVEQMVLYGNNSQSADVANFDNLIIDNNYAGGGGPTGPVRPVPNLSTIGLILLSLGLLFMVRRKLVL